MARAFDDASSQYLYGSLTQGVPLTMACWFYPLRTDANSVVMSLSKAGGTERFYLVWSPTTNLVEAGAANSENTAGRSQYSITPASHVNKWSMLAGRFESRYSRYAQFNGNDASQNVADIVASPDTAVIASRINSGSYGAYFDGYVAHAAVWNAALSEAELDNLYNNGIGADPRSVRPDALIAYWPLLNNDGDQDYWGNFHLTASGSPTYAQHPPVLMRSRPKHVILGSAAPTVGEVTITGTRTIGETITANATPTPGDATLTYQWEKSATGSGSGTDISGETASTLALTYADFGDILDTAAYVRCGVVATKDAVPSVETFSSWLEVSAGGAASVGSPFVSSSIR